MSGLFNQIKKKDIMRFETPIKLSKQINKKLKIKCAKNLNAKASVKTPNNFYEANQK